MHRECDMARVAPTSACCGSRLNSDNSRLHCFLRVIVTPPRALHPSWWPRFSPLTASEIISFLEVPASLPIFRAIERNRLTLYRGRRIPPRQRGTPRFGPDILGAPDRLERKRPDAPGGRGLGHRHRTPGAAQMTKTNAACCLVARHEFH